MGSKRVSVFLNEDDYERVLTAARRTSRTVPAYLRMLAAGDMPRTTDEDQLVNALANVANRIESARDASDSKAAEADLDVALQLARSLLNQRLEGNRSDRSPD